MLRMLVDLVLNVVSTLRMRPSRLPAECHTDVPPAAVPGEKNDTSKETPAVQQDSRQALMLSSTRSVRPSMHEGRLTTVSHTSPSPSVSLTSSAIHLPRLRRWRTERGTSSTAEGGGGGRRALARMTEGVLRPTPDKNAPV